MKNSDIFQKIESLYSSFSKGQKKIANYIKENYDKAAFMTAANLSEHIGVSCSTVVRFAVELGYEGYPQLQDALQRIVRTKLTSVQRMDVTLNRMGNRDIFSTILNYDIANIKQTLDEMDEEAFENATNTLVHSKTIYILGVRSAYSLAQFLSFYLNVVFDDVRLMNTTSSSEMFEQLLRINENDTLIAISFPRYSSRTVKAVKYARSKNANVLAITDSVTSPLNDFATATLTAKSDIASFADSLVAPLSVINALIAAIGIKKQQQISDTFDKLEKIWDEYEVYKNTDEK